MESPLYGKKSTGLENYEQCLESKKHNIEGISNDSLIDSKNIPSSDFKCSLTIKCSVCDLSFSSVETFQNHALTKEHAMKIMQNQVKSSAIRNPNDSIKHPELNIIKEESTSEESVLPELNNKRLYLSYGNCEVCKKIFSGPEPYKQHIESQAHKKKVELQQSPSYSEGNVFKCEPCEKSFSGQVPYTQHMCSEVHKKKLKNIQVVEKYLSGETGENVMGGKEDENKLWFCNICKLQCSGSIPYLQHMDGATHLKNVKRMQILSTDNIPQSMNGSYQVDNAKNQDNFVKPDSTMNSVQTSNSNENKISEKSENMSQIMNGNFLKDNGIGQNISLLSEKVNELKVVSCDELTELIKIISPNEKINFDKADLPKDSSNEKPDIINQGEKGNVEELKQTQEDNENGYDENLKKNVYQTCKFCNVSLFDKDSAIEHFESKEHYIKRWGS